MINYLNNVLNEFPEHLETSLLLIDADHLFNVIPKIKENYLYEEQARVLHHTVAQILIMSS